jgi:hypothetical protein
VFEPETIRRVALALRTIDRYVEKDWHLVRALGVIASIQVEGVAPAFSGGTSLATAWQLIRRFSEDIDFKVAIKASSASAERKIRSAYREAVIKALIVADFVLDGEPLIGNKSQFFRASFHYGAVFPLAAGVRPTLQIEMTFTGTHLPPTPRSIQSLLGRTLRAQPEIADMPCVDPVETAADKLSALAWRTAMRDRNAATDDPTIVRHLHDLAALTPQVLERATFAPLAREVLQVDARRTNKPGAEGLALLRAMLPKILSDRLWRREYEEFVGAVSFGPDNDRISFEQAARACGKLVSKVLDRRGA